MALNPCPTLFRRVTLFPGLNKRFDFCCWHVRMADNYSHIFLTYDKMAGCCKFCIFPWHFHDIHSCPFQLRLDPAFCSGRFRRGSEMGSGGLRSTGWQIWDFANKSGPLQLFEKPHLGWSEWSARFLMGIATNQLNSWGTNVVVWNMFLFFHIYIYIHTYGNKLILGINMSHFWYWEFHHPNWRTPSFFRGGGLEHQRRLAVVTWAPSCTGSWMWIFVGCDVHQERTCTYT